MCFFVSWKSWEIGGKTMSQSPIFLGFGVQGTPDGSRNFAEVGLMNQGPLCVFYMFFFGLNSNK